MNILTFWFYSKYSLDQKSGVVRLHPKNQIIIYLAFVRQNFFKYRNALFIIFLYVL
jgi:hypothetical protein